MTVQEKTTEEIAHDLLANEERRSGVDTVLYLVDPEKLSQYSYKAIADKFNRFFGGFNIDVTDDGTILRMFLDCEIGPFLSLNEEKVEIL